MEASYRHRSQLRGRNNSVLLRCAGTFIVSCLLLIPVCSCSRPAPGIAAPEGSNPVTFHQHIAPIVFQHCASCHTYDGHNGLGNRVEKPSAPDLQGFASREWLKGFFDPKQFAGIKYFGGTAHGVNGEMVDVVEKVHDKEDLGKVIAALSAEARLPGQSKIDERDKNIIEEGFDLLEGKPFSCTKCHDVQSQEYEDTDGPDLTSYGSRSWMLAFLHDPNHVRFYPDGLNDRMPAFGKDEKLTRRQMERIVDWLRGE